MDRKGFSKSCPSYYETTLLIFLVSSYKDQLKIVNNVVFVKLKRNSIILYRQLQSPRPSQCPSLGRALRWVLGLVSAPIEKPASKAILLLLLYDHKNMTSRTTNSEI